MERNNRRYAMVSKRIIGVSSLFQRGKTHIPVDVRNILNVEEGDKIVWVLENGKLYIKSAINSI